MSDEIKTFLSAECVDLKEPCRAVIASTAAYPEVMYRLVKLGGYLMSEKEYCLFEEKNNKTENLNAMLFAIGAKTCMSHKFLIYTVKDLKRITAEGKSVPFVYVIPATKEVLK